MGDIYSDADDMRRQMQGAAQQQYEDLVRQYRERFGWISRELAEYLIGLERRIQALEQKTQR